MHDPRSRAEIARARDRRAAAAEKSESLDDASRARSKAREQDSEAMLALRRQWSTMSRGPSNASLCLRDDDDEATEEARTRTRARGGDGTRAGGASDGGPDAKKNAHRASPNTVAPEKRRHTAAKSSTKGNLKARLAEVLIPTRSVPSNEWRFNTRVTGLNLANASIGPEGAAFLAKALHGRENPDGSWAFNVTLRSLNLEFNSIGDEGACAILDALSPKWVPGPKSSDVGSSNSGRWICNGTVAELNLNFCDVGPAGAAALASALAPRVDPATGGWLYLGGITHVSLFHNHIGPEGARSLSDALRPRAHPETGAVSYNPSLRSLNVGRNQLGDAGLAHVARAFAPVRDPRTGDWVHNPTFKHLHANMNSCLSQEGPLALGEAFAPRRQPSEQNDVSSEDVSETLVGVNQAVVAANAIIPAAMPVRTSRWAFARNLSTLHLANVLLGEEGGRAIARVLAPRPERWSAAASANVDGEMFPPLALNEDLCGGSGGEHNDAGLDELLWGDRDHSLRWTFPSNLKVLNLSRSGLGDGGVKHLADALRPRLGGDGAWAHNRRLRELHVGGAVIGPEGARALADALAPRRHRDRFLEEQQNKREAPSREAPPSDAAGRVKCHWSGWAHNETLQVLDVRYNVMGAEGLSALAEALAPIDLERDVAGADGRRIVGGSTEGFAGSGSPRGGSDAAFASPGERSGAAPRRGTPREAGRRPRPGAAAGIVRILRRRL